MVDLKFDECFPVVYLAHPYMGSDAASTLSNISSSRALMFTLMREGFVVLCPNVLCAGGEFTLPGLDGSDWLARDFRLLARCDLLYLAGQWRSSAGCLREFEYAIEHNIPVFFGDDVWCSPSQLRAHVLLSRGSFFSCCVKRVCASSDDFSRVGWCSSSERDGVVLCSSSAPVFQFPSQAQPPPEVQSSSECSLLRKRGERQVVVSESEQKLECIWPERCCENCEFCVFLTAVYGDKVITDYICTFNRRHAHPVSKIDTCEHFLLMCTRMGVEEA